MTETLIKVDLSQSAYDNEMVHNRWHPDIPMVATVKPGDDFIIETYDWTGGFIKNDNDASDVRDIDLSIVHFLSGPIGVKGAEPGDLLVVDILDIGPITGNEWGFNGAFSKKNGGGFLTNHFPTRAEVDLGYRGHVHEFAPCSRDPFRGPRPSRPDRLPSRSEAARDLEQARDGVHRRQPKPRDRCRQSALRADRPYGRAQGRGAHEGRLRGGPDRAAA